MPLCGFNDKMLRGLTALCEGLVEHGLEYRCEKNEETIDQGIKREISDMTRLLLEIDEIDDSAKRVLTEGIIKFAQGFYLLMRRNDVGDYRAVIERLMAYFYFMDKRYYGELEGKSDDMIELVQALNKKGL